MSVPSAVLALIEQLVRLDTTSHRSNLEAISLLQDRLTALGAVCHRTYDDGHKKANLFATLGPLDRPGVMLSGHTDVVPVTGQDWQSDPFRMTARDGRFYGRGVADMKSFLGLAVAMAPEFLARDLHTPLHFAFSYDEELGCLGVRRLIADLPNHPIRPRLCIVGEPTLMRVIAGHKGKTSLCCHVHGLAAHSALASGVNAVEAAAELVTHIGGIQKRLRRDGPFDARYEPPFTTLHTGLIQGGQALNIVPTDCRFEFEIRALPSQNSAALLAEITDFAAGQLWPDMRAQAERRGVDLPPIDFEMMNDTAGFDLPDDDPAVTFVTALTGDNRTGRVSFGTEAGLFNRAGIPTVVCGPGSIEQAHKPDEFIDGEQLALGAAFLRRLMDQLCRN